MPEGTPPASVVAPGQLFSDGRRLGAFGLVIVTLSCLSVGPQPATQNNRAGNAWQGRRARRRAGALSLGKVSLQDRAGRSPQRRCRRPQVVTALAGISFSTCKLPVIATTAGWAFSRGAQPTPTDHLPMPASGTQTLNPLIVGLLFRWGASWLDAGQGRRGGLRGKR